MTKMKFTTIKAGANRLNKERIPKLAGESLGIKKETTNTIAKTLFSKNKNLLKSDNLPLAITDHFYYPLKIKILFLLWLMFHNQIY